MYHNPNYIKSIGILQYLKQTSQGGIGGKYCFILLFFGLFTTNLIGNTVGFDKKPLKTNLSYTAECIDGNAAQTFTFNSITKGGTGDYSIAWQILGLSVTYSDGGESINYTFDQAGSYNVIVKATDSDFNYHQRVVNIIVEECVVEEESEEGGCEAYVEIPIPYSFDGSGEYCWVTSGTINDINSWGLELLEINGTVFTNQFITILPDKIDGYYYIRYISNVNWGHFEMDGNQNDEIGLDCETIGEINSPYSFEASGEHCWVTSGTIEYINSWSLELLEINGVVLTNQYTTNLPDKIDGNYYIHFISNVSWGHFEIGGNGGGEEEEEVCPVDFVELSDIGLNSNSDNWAVSWGDYNADGNVDLFVTTYDANSPNQLFKNNGDGTFTKINNGGIVTDLASSTAASWADYDNDNDLDLFVANNIGKPNFLYRNEGGGNFIRIQNDPIVSDLGYSHGVSWADYDKDGYLDLFVASFFATKFNTLYHNNGDGTFSKTPSNSITIEASSSISGAWADYNNDGLIDLFVANTNEENNSLYENKGNGEFLKINAGAIVNDGGHSVGGSWADYDNDGDLDLFVANASDEDNFLYQNNGDGSFTRIIAGIMVNDKGHSHGSSWMDYDNDGWIDLFVANDQNQDNFLYHNSGDGTFTKTDNVITESGGLSFGTAWADFDNDGGMDLFVANREGNENFIYQNVNGDCKSKTCITLVGTNSNHSAIGAKIYVKANIGGQTITQMREITAQSGGGIGGQNELKIIFGLGDAKKVKLITVKWPSGHIQTLKKQKINKCLVITEENASRVSGTVYHDENENCEQDENEIGLPNQKILISPGSHVVFSDENGNYEAFLAPGNYDFVLESGNNWTQSCVDIQSAQKIKTKKVGKEYAGINFGNVATCNFPDLMVEAAVTAHRVGFENLIALTFQNNGTVDANNVVLNLHLDPNCIPLESTIPWDSQDGQTITWIFPTLKMATKQTIYIKDMVIPSTPIGQELIIGTDIEADGMDCNLVDNAFREGELAIGALDPNDILVLPEGSIKKEQILTYKIRFQNVGNIPVSKVRVKCVLPKELDRYSFELGVGSHPFRFEQKNRELYWEFPNINLPDSVHNELESHGFVTFRILPKTNLAVGTLIENEATIFFDNLAAVPTNVVSNTILPDISEESYAGKLIVYPNPSKGLVNIQLIPLEWSKPDIIRHIELFNLQGKPIKRASNLDNSQLNWDLSGLTPGIYYIRATDKQGTEHSARFFITE